MSVPATRRGTMLRSRDGCSCPEYQAGQTHDRRLVTNPRRDTLRLWRVGRAGGVHVTDVSTEHWEAAVRIPPDKRCQLAGAMLKQSLGDLALHAPRIHALDQRAA